MFKVSETTTFGFSTSKTTTKSDKHTMTYSGTISANVKPNESVCVVLEATMKQYEAAWEADVCFDGYFRCQYGKRCDGHYYHYHHFWTALHDKRCQTLKGTAKNNSYSTSKAEIYPGTCEELGYKTNLSAIAIGA